MKKYMPIYLVALFILYGCSSSYLKNSTNVSQTKKNYKKILVVVKSQDKTARINFENQLVNDLAIYGINAKTSMEVIKNESFGKVLTEKELNALRKTIITGGFDGVVVTNLINKAQYTDVDPGRVGTTYVPTRYGRFGRYYRSYPVNYWEPDEVKVGVEYTLESCLYDLTVTNGDNLQWVGRFQVKDPKNLIKTIGKYSQELTEALMEQSISK